MKKLTMICVLVVLTLTAFAQGARKFTVNITADGASNMVCYLPEQPMGRAVVILPGGGYSHLAVDHEGHDWAPWFNEQGIACFVLTYRMPHGDRTIPLGDAQQAIRTVRDSALAWRVNPVDVGIMGFSAGGHLASAVSTHSQPDCRPDFSILFYPVISMNQLISHQGSCVNFLGREGANDSLLVKEWSSENAVRSRETPPAIILTNDDDTAVPPLTNGVAYYQALHRAGIASALHVYPTGGHGFGFRTTYKYHDLMLADLRTWLGALKPHKRIYIPEDLRAMDLQNDTSLWSLNRSVETPDIIVMWQRGFGKDVSKAPALDGHPMTFDLRQLTNRVQGFYEYFRDSLQFLAPRHGEGEENRLSKADLYKMMVMVNYSLEGTAYGGTYDDFIGALWVAPNRIQDRTMNCIAHELGHSFQMQMMADSVSDCWGGTGFFEMTSQWMLWQVNPNWVRDENYHFEAFRKLTHKAYLAGENIYHSPYVIQWWSDLHGKPSIAQLYLNGRRGEDPVMTYQRLYDQSQYEFCDEMFQGYRHLVNFDFKHAREETRPYACTFDSEVVDLPGGWQQPRDTLEAYGFHAIRFDHLLTGEKPLRHVNLTVRGSNLRYGFLAVTASGRSVYSPIGATTFVLPQDEQVAHLYLVVMAAPPQHQPLSRNVKPAQYPFQFKVK